MTEVEAGWDQQQYVLDHGDDYFASQYGRADFIPFAYRVASLAWLHSRIAESVDIEVAELKDQRRTGVHRVPGWEGESDMVLEESLYTLDTDTRQIGVGVVVVAAVAALESLMNQMLGEPGDARLHRAGLTQKANALQLRWQTVIDATEFGEHIAWLRDRRNSFAHRLIDDDSAGPSSTRTWAFDDDTAEEALSRIGAVARMLEEGREQELTALD
ncbi:hypothetical protein [Streptomyces sp. NPDC005148]